MCQVRGVRAEDRTAMFDDPRNPRPTPLRRGDHRQPARNTGRRDARCAGDRGGAFVELALVLPLMASLAFGTLDVGRAFALKSRLTDMAREGALYAQFHPFDVSG